MSREELGERQWVLPNFITALAEARGCKIAVPHLS